jgi:hypothetical protein
MIGNSVACANRLSYRPGIRLALSIGFVLTTWVPRTKLATVFGIITDPSDAVVPEAKIRAENVSTALKRNTTLT